MGKGKGGKFQPGKSGNPSGRPKLTEQDKIVRKLTRETWNDLCEKMMQCSEDELRLLSEDTRQPYEVVLFLRHVLALGIDPDMQAYEKYLARRIGPVKAEVDVNLIKPTIIRRRNGEEIVLTTMRDLDPNGIANPRSDDE